MKKRLYTVFIIFAMLMSSLAGCSGGHFQFSEEDAVTRGQWIEQLSNTFGLSDHESDDPYFSDVPSSDPLFSSVQSCYEWNVLRDVKDTLRKDDKADMAFVISTAVYAIDPDLSAYEGESDLDKALLYAQENGIVASQVNREDLVDQERCTAILEAAQELYLHQEVTPVKDIEIKEGVKDEREQDHIRLQENGEYVFSDLKPEIGEVYIAPATDEDPQGVAIKVSDVTDNGNGTYTVKATTPEASEVFEEFEYRDILVPEYEDIEPAEGVTISGLQGGDMGETGFVGSGAQNNGVSVATASPLIASGSNSDVLAKGKKNSGLSFSAEINFTKGSLKVSKSWNSASLSVAGLLNAGNVGETGFSFEEKSIFPDKTLFGPEAYTYEDSIKAYEEGEISADELKTEVQKFQDENGHETIPEMTNKYEGGLEVIGTLSISDLYIVPDIKLKTAEVLGVDTGIPIGIQKFSIETNYEVSSTLSLKGKLENELEVCTIPVVIGGIGKVDVTLSLYATANGEIEVKMSVANNTKAEYSSGKTKKTSTKDGSFSTEAQMELEAGPKISAELDILGLPIIDAEVSAGIQVNATGSFELSSDWTETPETIIIDQKTSLNYATKGYIPIVTIGVGNKKGTLANKIDLKFTYTVVGAEGKGLIAAKSFDILPEETCVLWERRLELPKDTTASSQPEDAAMGSNLDISSYYIPMTPGEESQIEVNYPEGYGADDFDWFSSDSGIVEVANGRLTAKGTGNARVSIKSKDGKYYAYCAIHVADEETVTFEGL